MAVVKAFKLPNRIAAPGTLQLALLHIVPFYSNDYAGKYLPLSLIITIIRFYRRGSKMLTCPQSCVIALRVEIPTLDRLPLL